MEGSYWSKFETTIISPIWGLYLQKYIQWAEKGIVKIYTGIHFKIREYSGANGILKNGTKKFPNFWNFFLFFLCHLVKLTPKHIISVKKVLFFIHKAL